PGEHIPIVAMTAHALGSDRDRALAAGMDDFMTKPVRRTDLERMLFEQLQRRTSAEQREPGSLADSEEGFDETIIDSLMNLGGAELVVELFELFLEDLPGRLAAT